MRRFPPTILGKVNTAVQVTAVLAVLVSALWPQIEPVASTLLYVVVLLTLASGIDYIFRASRLQVQTPPAE